MPSVWLCCRQLFKMMLNVKVSMRLASVWSFFRTWRGSPCGGLRQSESSAGALTFVFSINRALSRRFEPRLNSHWKQVPIESRFFAGLLYESGVLLSIALVDVSVLTGVEGTGSDQNCATISPRTRRTESVWSAQQRTGSQFAALGPPSDQFFARSFQAKFMKGGTSHHTFAWLILGIILASKSNKQEVGGHRIGGQLHRFTRHRPEPSTFSVEVI